MRFAVSRSAKVWQSAVRSRCFVSFRIFVSLWAWCCIFVRFLCIQNLDFCCIFVRFLCIQNLDFYCIYIYRFFLILIAFLSVAENAPLELPLCRPRSLLMWIGSCSVVLNLVPFVSRIPCSIFWPFRLFIFAFLPFRGPRGGFSRFFPLRLQIL